MLCIGPLTEEVAGQPHHVVRAATLFRRRAELGCGRIGFVPHFAVAGAAGAVAVVIRDDAVEVLRDGKIARVSRELIAADCADDLGDVGVGVVAAKIILVGCEGLEDLLVLEAVAEVAILWIACDGVEIERCFVASRAGGASSGSCTTMVPASTRSRCWRSTGGIQTISICCVLAMEE